MFCPNCGSAYVHKCEEIPKKLAQWGFTTANLVLECEMCGTIGWVTL